MLVSAALLVSALRASPDTTRATGARVPTAAPSLARPSILAPPPTLAPPPPSLAPTSHKARTARWRQVLAVLDRRRSRAYAELAPRLLRGVYTARSTVLRHDRALLSDYRRRGLRVCGMRMRVLSLRVRARDAGRVLLRVRERLAPGAAVVGGDAVRRLPADAVGTRLLNLRRVEGRGPVRWRISAVRPA